MAPQDEPVRIGDDRFGCARSGNAGVSDLWQDMCRRIESFTFGHGPGLGVLAVGFDSARMIHSLVTAGASEVEGIQRFFASLGRMHGELTTATHKLGRLDTPSDSDRSSRGANRAADVRPPRISGKTGGCGPAASDP